MKRYLFSLFTRAWVALSGLLVFLVTAYVFGAGGRGVISYGTSVFASVGIICSFNLGRTFLDLVTKNNQRKNELLSTFIVLNLAAAAITILGAMLFWFLSSTAQSILSWHLVLGLSFLALYYVWSINGNAIFAALERTYEQEVISDCRETSLKIV